MDFIEFEFDSPPEPEASDIETEALMEAQKLIEARDFEKAAVVLDKLSDTDQLARRLLLACLQEIGDMPRIISRFDPPTGASEMIVVMDALWSTGQKDQLKKLISQESIAATTDLSVAELRNKYAARLK